MLGCLIIGAMVGIMMFTLALFLGSGIWIAFLIYVFTGMVVTVALCAIVAYLPLKRFKLRAQREQASSQT